MGMIIVMIFSAEKSSLSKFQSLELLRCQKLLLGLLSSKRASTLPALFVRTAGLGKDKKEFDLPDKMQGAIRHWWGSVSCSDHIIIVALVVRWDWPESCDGTAFTCGGRMWKWKSFEWIQSHTMGNIIRSSLVCLYLNLGPQMLARWKS